MKRFRGEEKLGEHTKYHGDNNCVRKERSFNEKKTYTIIWAA